MKSFRVMGALFVMLVSGNANGMKVAKYDQVQADNYIAQLGYLTFATPKQQAEGARIVNTLRGLGKKYPESSYTRIADSWDQVIGQVSKGEIAIDPMTREKIVLRGGKKGETKEEMDIDKEKLAQVENEKQQKAEKEKQEKRVQEKLAQEEKALKLINSWESFIKEISVLEVVDNDLYKNLLIKGTQLASGIVEGYSLDDLKDPKKAKALKDALLEAIEAGFMLREKKKGLFGVIQHPTFDLSSEFNKKLDEKIARLTIDKTAVAEKEAAEKDAAEKLASEKAIQEKTAAEKVAAEKADKEKEATEKAAAQKAAVEKAAAQKAAVEKAAAEKAAQEKAATEKVAEEKAAQEKAAKEKVATEKVASEKAATEKLAAQEKAAKERAAQELAAAEKAEAEKLAAEEAKKTDEEKRVEKYPEYSQSNKDLFMGIDAIFYDEQNYAQSEFFSLEVTDRGKQAVLNLVNTYGKDDVKKFIKSIGDYLEKNVGTLMPTKNAGNVRVMRGVFLALESLRS